MDDRRAALILGGRGQVARSLLAHAPAGAAVALGRAEVDITNRAAVSAALDEHGPYVVINAAVFHPVDLCETEVSKAFAVNAVAPAMLAAQCTRRDVRLVHISTDYVFDGSKRRPFSEEDCPAPVNVYGRSKLAGEHGVLAADPRHCVVRTSSVYGRPSSKSGVQPFAVRMLQRALSGEATRVVTDQVVSPTRADDLARALWQLIDRGGSGLFHLAGSTPASWYEVAHEVFRFAGRTDLLSRTTSAAFGAPAPRAPYTALTSTRLAPIGIDPPPGFDAVLQAYLRETFPDVRGS